MADVGILNLQINDNSSQAVQGLEKIESALSRIKGIVSSGIGLSGVARQLESIAKVVNESITGETLSKLNSLTESLARLNGLGNVNIKIKSAGQIQSTVRTLQEGQEALSAINSTAKETTGGLHDGFTQVASSVSEATSELARMKSSAEGALNGQSRLDFSVFDPSKLPINALGQQLSDSAQEWNQYGNAVKDTFQIIRDGGMMDHVTTADDMKRQSTAIIMYNDEIRQSFNAINETMSQMPTWADRTRMAEERVLEVFHRMQAARAARRNPYGVGPERTLEDYYNGMRWYYDGNGQSHQEFVQDNMYNWLRGNGTEGAQEFALKQMAQEFQMTVEEVKARVEELRAASQTAAPAVEKMSEAMQSAIQSSAGGAGNNAFSEQANQLAQGMNQLAESGNSARNAMDMQQELTGATTGASSLEKTLKQLDIELQRKKKDADALRTSFTRMRATFSSATPEANRLTDALENANNVNTGNTGTNTFQSGMENIASHMSRMTDTANAARSAVDMRDRFDSSARGAKGLNVELKGLDKELKQKKADAGGAREAFSRFGDQLRRLLKPISDLLRSFKRIIMYRMMRAVLKHITEGFSEGVEHMYRYSKAIGKDFAPAMDSAATALAQMKNAVGAAAAPAIQALIPLLNSIVSGFITLVNYVNQFFSLLRGQTTWTRALPKTTNAFEKTEKAAKGTGAAIKDLLADWDELNIIQSESGGGGGGGAAKGAEDYLKMFEEVSVFDDRVKRIVNFIRENMNDVIDMVKNIGIALLAWRFANAFTGPLGTLAALVAAGKVLEVTWKLTELFDNEYVKDGDTGWLVKDMLTSMLGSAIAATIVDAVLGHGAGLITLGIGMTVSAATSYSVYAKDPEGDYNRALKKLSAIKLLIGAAAMAAGFGIATGSAFGAIFGGATAGVMFTLVAAVKIVVEQYRTAADIAKEAFAEGGNGGISVDDIFKALQDKMTEAYKKYKLVIEAFSGSAQLKTDLSDAFATVEGLSAVIKGGGKLTQEEANQFKQAWGTVFSTFEGLTATYFNTLFTGLNVSLQSENDKIRETAKQIRVSMLMIEKNVTQAIAEAEIEQQELADKVATGKASDVEIEQYFANLEAMSSATKTAMSDFERAVENKDRIDFGDKDNAVTNAVNFVNSTAAAATAATEEIDKGYQDLMEAADGAWKNIESLHNLKKLDDETYNSYKEIFDQMRENFTQAADDNKKKVTDTAESAYRQVFDQMIASIGNMEGIIGENGAINNLELIAFFGDVMTPVLAAMQDAGYNMGEEFSKMFGIGLNLKDYIAQGKAEDLVKYIRETLGIADPVVIPVEVETVALLDESKQNIAQKFSQSIDKVVSDSMRDSLAQYYVDTYGADTMRSILRYLPETAQEALMRVFENKDHGPVVEVETVPVISGDAEQLYNDMMQDLADGFDTTWSQDMKNSRALYYLNKYGSDAISGIMNHVPESMQEALQTALAGGYHGPAVEIETVPVMSSEAAEMYSSMMQDLANGYDATWTPDMKNSKAQYYLDKYGEEALRSVLDYIPENMREVIEGVMGDTVDTVQKTKEEVEGTTFDVAAPQTTEYKKGLDDMLLSTKQMIGGVATYLDQLNGVTVGVDTAMTGSGMNMRFIVHKYANGGFPVPGELALVNEDGLEMIGQMNNRPAVANNQQIVSGISEGVSTANGEVVSELRTVAQILNRLLQKEFVAKAVPGSGWGEHNARSQAAFERVTG